MPFIEGHALLIGVSSYAHTPALSVPITSTDAQAVAAVLANPTFCSYPAQQVRLLADATATRDGVLVALEALASRADEGDTVMVFYAGHGEYGDDGYYLTTHDTQIQGHKVVVGTGIRLAELIERLRAVQSKRVLLIINACHASEISPLLGAGAEPFTGTPLPPNASAALLSTGEGRVIITACRDGQVSYSGPGPLTLFTHALVDGLQGKGVGSSRGYISVFDLYTHLYFTLDDTVAKRVSAVTRQRYGEKQEPELTVLKGVGPFAVALYRGATSLGEFDTTGTPVEGTAVREVSPAYSKAMLQQFAPRQHQQTVSGNAQVGTAITGDVQGNVTVTQQRDPGQRGGVHFGSGGQFGDITIGDVAGRDIIRTDITQGDRISTGDITGSSGIAIGRGAQSIGRKIDTGGGDYAEGNIDKRKGTFVRGDQSNLSGDFGGSILNIRSTLAELSQSIDTAPYGDAGVKAQMQSLITQLGMELQKAPLEVQSVAEAVAVLAKRAAEQAMKERSNSALVELDAAALRRAAQNLSGVLPSVLPITMKFSELITNLSRV